MAHVCPWWLTYGFDNPLRRLVHDRRRILRPLVREGMVVADIGCGMGFFTEALADLVGPEGRVVAIDVQQRQLDHTVRRCERARLGSRVEPVLADAGALTLDRPLDLALSFWMLHEVDRPERFVADVAAALRPGASWLVAEPRLHVSAARFAQEVGLVERAGLASAAIPIRWSRARLFTKPPSSARRHAGGDRPVRIRFDDLAIVRGGNGRFRLHLLKPTDDIHGELRIEIRGKPLPRLGYWGPSDVCFGEWLRELATVRDALARPPPARHVYDEGEQGQPAYVFEKDAEGARVTVARSELSEADGDPEWQRVPFPAAEFVAEHDRFRAELLAHLRAIAPGAADAWLARLGMRG